MTKNFLIFPENPKMPHSEMVFVKGGSFMMGSDDEDAYKSEKPTRRVTVPDFYIGKYPVTQAVWERVMGKKANKSRFKGKNRPVEQVSWNTITQEFLPKLPDKGIEGWSYNLPSEAMWEYAAKGGIESKQYKYSGSDDLNEVGWYEDNSHQENKPVGLKAPNELDLYDMSGNLFEWCIDKWSKDSELRVIRGGSWFLYQRRCRPSFRSDFLPDFAYDFIGFRLVFSFTS